MRKLAVRRRIGDQLNVALLSFADLSGGRGLIECCEASVEKSFEKISLYPSKNHLWTDHIHSKEISNKIDNLILCDKLIYCSNNKMTFYNN